MTVTMASSDKELEQQLMEAGTKLVNPPSSVDELLPLLNVSPNFFFCITGLFYTFILLFERNYWGIIHSFL